mmetsp:Transcript_16790/g.39205  ORF Transcript_16790/g.39205 Transcript_16790/m.39205 type:complete len:237 (-) Transcript_16790:180-890(-)
MRRNRDADESLTSLSTGRDGRSRVPKSSQPGQANNGGAGGAFGGAETGEAGRDKASFEALNDHFLREQGGGSVEKEEDPARVRMREALDDGTRKRQARDVKRVLRSVEQDYYKVLGIRRGYKGSSKIRSEYRHRALDVHPDKNMDVDAPKAFKVLQDAYETLSDPRLRDEYDRMLKKKARVQRARVVRHVGHAYQGLSEIAQFSWKQTSEIALISWKQTRQRVSWPVFFFVVLVLM